MSTRLIYPETKANVLYKPVQNHSTYYASKEKLSDYVIKYSSHEVRGNMNKRDSSSCVIVVGSTGAGKSSTVTKYTGVVTRLSPTTTFFQSFPYFLRCVGLGSI